MLCAQAVAAQLTSDVRQAARDANIVAAAFRLLYALEMAHANGAEKLVALGELALRSGGHAQARESVGVAALARGGVQLQSALGRRHEQCGGGRTLSDGDALWLL